MTGIKIAGLSIGAIVLLMVLSVVPTYYALGWGWAVLPGQIHSVSHVSQEYQFAYTYINSLKAEAANVCLAESNLKADTQGGASLDQLSLDRQQVLATSQTYNNTKAAYDAELANTFQAKQVKPTDVPFVAPTLAQGKSKWGGC
jgi:hypothetical protein